ncbi:MAG: type II glyceraldehyde-3-phosphate dehydrogenase [Candidatus Methanoplasma sp.]|jgi:glyceraldehyde-3-phosphate dehydrogenase (NAD(P))|nr:type II glyceraldehyde-3-phosphate dehydrogenase [Candidatus Methanoplasma sp.]
MSVAKVGINGYGTIGKRVADAVRRQGDMEVAGVTKTRPTFEARVAAAKGFDIYVPPESVKPFADAGIEIAGTIGELYGKVDIMVDCTPGDVGERYKAEYSAAGIKAIFQGGEDHSLTGVSFNSTANYRESWGAQFSRVVSCNTTGLLRTLCPIDRAAKIRGAHVTIVRRAADPGDSKGGPVNGLEPSLKLPTHHGPDVQSVMPWLNITTMAVKASTTLMHLHAVAAELERDMDSSEALEILRGAPRVRMVSGKSGIKTTAEAMELARDLGRDRSDMYEIVVWEDGVKAVGNRLYFYQAVHQESDVVPENVDCIRSMCKLEEDASASMAMTDRALGISKG